MKPKLSVKVAAAVAILAVESIESVRIYHERRKEVNPIKKADKKGTMSKARGDKIHAFGIKIHPRVQPAGCLSVDFEAQQACIEGRWQGEEGGRAMQLQPRALALALAQALALELALALVLALALEIALAQH